MLIKLVDWLRMSNWNTLRVSWYFNEQKYFHKFKISSCMFRSDFTIFDVRSGIQYVFIQYLVHQRDFVLLKLLSYSLTSTPSEPFRG